MNYGQWVTYGVGMYRRDMMRGFLFFLNYLTFLHNKHILFITFLKAYSFYNVFLIWKIKLLELSFRMDIYHVK